MHESVEVPDIPRAMLAGLSVHVRPVEGETVANNETVCSVNPLSEVTVIVEFPVAPGTIVTVVGLAETAKSSTLIVKDAEWDREPLMPVTVER